MRTVFKNKRISGILGILPENVSYFEDEVDNYTFPPKQTLRLKKLMGYESHRLAKKDSTASDFCKFGMQYLFDNQYISKDEIGAVVVVTLSPDYFLPQISNIIHGEFDLPQDVICMDIPQGCCGFLMGLMQSFFLLDYMDTGKKVVLCNAEVLSKKVSPKDRNDFPLIGDGASIAVIEHDSEAEDAFFSLSTDGTRREALKIPAGGFRLPSNAETAEYKDVGDGNLRALDHMHMDGTAVFSFVQEEVPGCVDDILSFAETDKEEIDYYLFHQPNKFMLQKLREKLNVPKEKFFDDLVTKYGNPSGVSIPLVITDNLADELKTEKNYKCCLSAFGSGLTWGALVMNLGHMEFCELKESNL